MNDLLIAKTQRNLTVLWLFGFFGLLIGKGMGKLDDLPVDSLFTMTGVVLFFWFQRQRSGGVPDPTVTTTTQDTRVVTTPTSPSTLDDPPK